MDTLQFKDIKNFEAEIVRSMLQSFLISHTKLFKQQTTVDNELSTSRVG